MIEVIRKEVVHLGRQVSIYLDEETIKRLDKIQSKETDRSRSFIIKRLLNEAIDKKEEK